MNKAEFEASIEKVNSLLVAGDKPAALQQAEALRASLLAELPAETAEALSGVEQAIARLSTPPRKFPLQLPIVTAVTGLGPVNY